MATKIFCLVLNYRHFSDTAKCLRKLRSADALAGTKFVVIDNSPENTPKNYFEKIFAGIKVIRNPGNFGFAAGNNVGIRYALKQNASHILIINPDVTVGKKFFKPLLSELVKSPKAGLIAPAIKHQQKGKTFFGLEGRVDWRTGKASHINLRHLPNLLSHPGGVKARPVQFVTFACVLIKAEVFRKVGLLDERYFMYLEDVDYCLSAGRAGFTILLNPGVVVNHETSSSFAKPTDKLFISFRSQLSFISKWLPFPRNIAPTIHTLFFYPYLYLLWTYQAMKSKPFRSSGNDG